MMIQLSDLGQVYLVCGKTDTRQGIDSLAYVVKSQLELNPFSGQVFLFCGGRKDRFKALYWDGQGFWPLYNLLREKLLEQALLHADETSYWVLESDSHLTYYWTFLSGKSEKQGITLYHHDQRRSGSVVQEFLGDYSGYVHCDMLRQ